MNPLHDWAVTVLQTGGTCELPHGLPPLVCHEVEFKQNQNGGRGSFWLLFSTANTPHDKEQFWRLTGSQITVEVNYGTKHTAMRYDFGPNWQSAQSLSDSFEHFRCSWEAKAGDLTQWLFPLVQREPDFTLQDETPKLITTPHA